MDEHSTHKAAPLAGMDLSALGFLLMPSPLQHILFFARPVCCSLKWFFSQMNLNMWCWDIQTCLGAFYIQTEADSTCPLCFHCTLFSLNHLLCILAFCLHTISGLGWRYSEKALSVDRENRHLVANIRERKSSFILHAGLKTCLICFGLTARW